MRMMKATVKTRRPELLKIEGRAVEINVRYNPRARRLIVKVHPTTGEVSVVAPSQRSLSRALEFAQGQSAWIAGQLSRVPALVPLCIGAKIPYRGVEHLVCLGQRGHGTVWPEVQDGAPLLRVSGHVEHHGRRLLDFLKREARREFEARTLHHTERLGVRHKHITVRDTGSRWGSCSAGKCLSFSWRLILAPQFVLDYVVAHEVAHLREMNHSPAFWRLVRGLVGDVEAPQQWLREHGAKLHRYAPKG